MTDLSALLAMNKETVQSAQTQAVVPTVSTSQPITQTQIIQANIAKLQEALLAKHPQMPTLLREIHRQLKDDPATVTLLSEDEIKTVVQGLEAQTGTFIAQSMTGAKGAATKKLKNVKSSDLGFDD